MSIGIKFGESKGQKYLHKSEMTSLKSLNLQSLNRAQVDPRAHKISSNGKFRIFWCTECDDTLLGLFEDGKQMFAVP